MAPPFDVSIVQPQVVNVAFDDIDAMAAGALQWDQVYQQIGRGRFRGQITQIVLGEVQLSRVQWSPGVLQRGATPKNTWGFGLPLKAAGSLHVRRRPTQRGELLAGTWRDDAGFSATGPTDLMIVVLPTERIGRWMQVRRGVDAMDPALAPRHWTVPPLELSRRARALSQLLDDILNPTRPEMTNGGLAGIESRICDGILGMIPSAEVVEGRRGRARIARALLQLLSERQEDPPSVTEMCALVGTRERTLFLSCVEAFGRPPAQLSLDLRLNAVQRALRRPEKGANVGDVAALHGFTHFGRFAAAYRRQFGELPSVTLMKARGGG